MFVCCARHLTHLSLLLNRPTHTQPHHSTMAMSSERAAQLLKLWDEHIATEFTEKSADAAVATMVGNSTVNHVPTMTG